MDAKALQDDLQSRGFTPSLAKPEMGKEVERRKARSHDQRIKCIRVSENNSNIFHRILTMTLRGGREASERRRGIEEDKRQPVMARLAARWRRFNLVKLVALRKGNHLGEAQVRRDRRKDLYKRERDSLDGSHEEAQLQRKALRRGKNLAFSEDTCLEKEKVLSKVTPKKLEWD